MGFRPTGDRVLVRRDSSRTTTPGGLTIPDEAQERLPQGTVVATSELAGMSFRRNDRVVFSPYAGYDVTVDGEKLLVLKEDDIIGIID